MNNLLKKVAVSVATVATVAGMGLMPFAAKAASPGEVYKTSDGTVWFITSDMQKRPFTSAGAFLSYGFLSFSQVKDADASVTALPTGSFIAPADGKIFCATATKDSDVKGECALITGGMKAAFTSAAVFTGQGFSFSRAINGDSSFLSKTSNIDTATAGHLPGVLVNNGGTVQMVVSGGLWGIPSMDVFNSWGYSFADVVPANAADKMLAQVGVIPARQAGQLVPSGAVTPPPSGAYSASLSSDNPGAGTLIAGQAVADLAHFTVMGSGTITSLKFKRIGVSADSTLSNAYLFDGTTRLTDSASVAGGYVTFAGLNWYVSGSKMFSFKSDIAGSTSGQTVGIQLTAVNGTDLSSMPSGNTFTIAAAPGTFATVAVSGASGTFTDPGKDINVFQGSVAVGNHSVTLNRLSLRQIGSIASGDISNFRLRVDGTTIATVGSVDSTGYVTFAPNTMLNSGTRTVSVLADVTGGSGRTVQFSLRGAYDITTTDSQFNVGVLATGTFPFGPAASTVAAGSLSIVKSADSPSTNVVACANDVVLGRWTYTAYGEVEKVETVTVGIIGNSPANITFRNGRLLVDGAQVGSTTDVAASAAAATGQAYTTNFYVTPGTPRIVEFRADMYDSNTTGGEGICGTATNTSAQAAIVIGSSNVIPQTSLTPQSYPASKVVANALTIATGTISLVASPTYPAQSFSAPQTNFKIGSFTLTGNSSEAVNLNTLTLDMTVANISGTTTPTVADVTNVYLMYGTSQTTPKGTISATGNTYTINTQLPVNGNMQIDVYGDLGTNFDGADTVRSKLMVSGVTANSTTAVTTNSGSTLNGQLDTQAAGSITASQDASTPIAQLVDDSGSVTTAAFKFAALTDSYTITDITFSVGSSPTVVSSIALMDGSTPIASKPVTGTNTTFNGLNIPVAANSSKVLTTVLTMSPIGVGAGTTDSPITTAITTFTARNSSGTSATGTGTPGGNIMYAYKALPTVSSVALPNSSLTGGEQVIAKFTVSSGGTGTIAWKQAMFEISKAAAPILSAATLYNSDTGAQITAASVYQNDTNADAACNASDTACELLITVGTNANDNVVETVSGAKTYEIRATITGTLATGNVISTKLDRNTAAHVASGLEQAVDNATTANDVSFVWSDESNATTGSTGVATWQGDYLVKNLPITWSLTR